MDFGLVSLVLSAGALLGSLVAWNAADSANLRSTRALDEAEAAKEAGKRGVPVRASVPRPVAVKKARRRAD